MHLKLSSIVLTFIWCLFMGVTAISIGFGALYPPMNRVAAPFVCPNGQMVFQQNTSNPLPGTTYITTAWYCVDGTTGKKTELGIFPMSIYAGLIYGFIFFIVVYTGMVVLANRRVAKQQRIGSAPEDDELNQLRALEASEKLRDTFASQQQELAGQMRKTRATTDAVAKMTELKKLRDANLISEEEYQAKRQEILDNL